MSGRYSFGGNERSATSADRPILGRQALLTQFERSIEQGAGGLLLVGAGGVGKSRLAREVLRLGEARGFATARTVATRAASSIPLGPLAPLIPQVAGRDGAGGVTAAVDELARLAAGRRLMMLVDDAHLLDDHSAAVLVQLTLRAESFLVVTALSREPLPDALVTLWKDEFIERVEIPPLDHAATVGVAGQVLDGDVDVPLGMVIAGRAQGNPLVARELSLAGRESGAIRLVDGVWRLTGEIGVSSRLVEIVMARFGSIDRDQRAALEYIALAEPLGLDLASEVTGADALGSLERAGIVVIRSDGRRRDVLLHHSIYSDAIRATMGSLATDGRLAVLAQLVEGTGMRRRGDVLKAASLRLQSRMDVDRELLMRAAEETHAMLDMAGTARMARGAWDRRPDVRSGVLSGVALTLLGRTHEAEAMLAAARDCAGTPVERAIAEVHRSFVLSQSGRGRDAESEAMLESYCTGTGGGDVRDLVQAHRAVLGARRRARTGETLDVATPLVDVPIASTRVLARYATVIALVNRGSYQAAVELIDRSIEDHRRAWSQGDVYVPVELLSHHRDAAALGLGELGESGWAASDLFDQIPGRRAAVRLSAMVAGRAALVRGRPDDLRSILQAFRPRFERTDRHLAALLLTAAALSGDRHEVIRHLEFVQTGPAARVRPFDALLDEAVAWGLYALGRHEQARRELRQAVIRSLEREEWGMALPMIHQLATLGDAAGAAGLLEGCGPVDGRLPAARVMYIEALASGDASRLDETATMFESVRADLSAADASAHAAQAWVRAGDRRRAAYSVGRAHELVAHCQGASTPGLVGMDSPTPLTDREREVVELAVAGLASRDIADALFISTRTVENHLHHAYTKLGVRTRADLVEVVGARPTTGGVSRPGDDSHGLV